MSSSRPSPGATARRETQKRGDAHSRIVLLRHAEPDWSQDDGPSVADPGLTPFGRAQAKETARRLAAEEELDAIYVSPYQRSQETARFLADACGREPITVEPLKEIGVKVEGLTQEQVDDYFVAGIRRPLDEHWDGWPDAETFRDFHDRATGALVDILGRHDVSPVSESDFTVWRRPERLPSIAIVAHGGTNAVLLTHLLDIAPVPWEWLRFESELAAYSVVQSRPIGTVGHAWSLQTFNEVSHLQAAGLR